jgi:hypothetical protein
MGIRRGYPLAAVALVTLGVLAACGSSGTGHSTDFAASPGASVGASTAPTASPSTTGPTSTPGGGGTGTTATPSIPGRGLLTAGPAQETIVGDVQDGVEPNCFLLRTNSNKLYQLVGGDRTKIKNSSSKHVSVDGREIPAMATTCQQGIPFLVIDIRPA